MRIELGVGVLAVAVSLASCGGGNAGDEHTAASTSPIQGGTTDTTHEFVVAVVQQAMGQAGFALCSGSLLAPNLIATARHCVASVSTKDIDCNFTTFGTVVPANSLVVTTDPDLSSATHFYDVEQVIVPSATGDNAFCGNDLALLILTQSVTLPEYVTPVVDPPMTDHSVYSTTVTAIGYGITTPTDTNGTTAGIRRIRENIDLGCIPNDKTFTDCLAEPGASEFISANEFQGGGGTCDGDSGSGAFEQRNFNAGKWVSFGVLSRGAIDPDSGTCVSPVYTRFDAWGDLLVSTAAEAARLGGYATPAWAVALGAEAGVPAAASPSADSGLNSGADSGSPKATSCLALSSACGTDSDCCSVNCISHDGTTYLCTSCNSDNPCNGGYECDNGTCVLADASASASVGTTQTLPPSNKGCSVTPIPAREPANALTRVAAWLFLGGLLRRKLRQRRIASARAMSDSPIR